MNAQRDIGSHLFRHIDRDVLQQSTVGVNGVFGSYGGENSGQGHCRSQSQRQRSIAENPRFSRHQVRGHASKRNGKIVEALYFRVGKRNLIENQRDLLAGVESLGELQSLAQAKLKAVRIVAVIFFAPEGEVVKRRLSRHYLVPVNALHHLANLGRIASGRIDPAHQTAHAGAGDIVHGNVMFFQPGDDAYVRQSESSATLQNQPERRMLFWGSFLLLVLGQRTVVILRRWLQGRDIPLFAFA